METLMQLFGSMMIFVYHCFDRMVINGYLSMLSRPERVVYFFKDVLAHQCITKEVLSARTNDYSSWIDSYARNHRIPIEWAEAGVRKEDYVRPYLKKTRTEEPIWRLLHPEKHGAGQYVPIRQAEIPNR